MLFRIYECLVAHGKCIFRKCISVVLWWGCKLISVFILPSNTIFRKTERELSERERGRRARAQREIEEEPRKPKRARLRRTQKLTLTNPENPRPSSFVVPIAPPARSSHPSTDPPKTDRSRHTPKPIVLDPDSSSLIAISPSHWSRPQSQHRFIVLDRDRCTPKPIILDPKTDRPLSLPSPLNLAGLQIFFFFKGLFVFLDWEWNYIFVWQLRKWENVSNK